LNHFFQRLLQKLRNAASVIGALPVVQKAVLAAVIVLIVGLAVPFYLYAVDSPSLHGKVTVTIPKNATARDIGDILENRGVISNSRIFAIAVSCQHLENRLHSGEYRIDQGLSVARAIGELQEHKQVAAEVTIPEGYTVHQMAALFKKAGIAGADQFEETARTYGPLKYQYGPEPVKVKGEGFLFPDTYKIPVTYTAKQICDMMYRRTDEVLTSEIRKQAAQKNLTLHDLMTIASMVEKEARFKEDQQPIASVILTRLDQGMPLQIDATIQYILGAPKENLSHADTQIQSPYNTYTRSGLPPGPIGAPGLDAIKAVLAATPGEYLYYVARPDGHHVFSKTLMDHEAAIQAIYGQQ
jgi:UPF0755 protein